VNGIHCKGLRDTGAFVPVIVDEKLVPKQHVNYNKTIRCVGLFSGEQAKCIPTANIKIRSPWFSVKGDIKVTAAVTKLPAGLICILGNSFFSGPKHTRHNTGHKTAGNKRGRTEHDDARTRPRNARSSRSCGSE